MDDLNPLPFYIDYVGTECDGTAVVAVHGDLDQFSCRELRSTLCLIGYVFNGVVVDLRAVADADEYLRSQHRSMILRHAPPQLARLRPLTPTDSVVEVGMPAPGRGG
jgi:hypothetical protein